MNRPCGTCPGQLFLHARITHEIVKAMRLRLETLYRPTSRLSTPFLNPFGDFRTTCPLPSASIRTVSLPLCCLQTRRGDGRNAASMARVGRHVHHRDGETRGSGDIHARSKAAVLGANRRYSGDQPKSPGNAGAAQRAAGETAGAPGSPSGRLARAPTRVRGYPEPRRLAPGRVARHAALRAGGGGGPARASGGRGFTQGVLPRSLSGVREAAPAAAKRLQGVVLRK